MAQLKKLQTNINPDDEAVPPKNGPIQDFPPAGGIDDLIPAEDHPSNQLPGGPSTDLPPGVETGRGQETPRDRIAQRRPMAPVPESAGLPSTSTAGVIPFNPMPGPQGVGLRSSLFGSAGGLQGGGLGVPLDPTSNVASDPIDTLIQALLNRGR